jgi:Domain of unknown function (DUF4262)
MPDDPQLAEYLDRVRGLIVRHGVAVQGAVDPDRGLTRLYTVGLTAHAHPELTIAQPTTISLVSAAGLLNHLAARAIAGPPLQAGPVDLPTDLHPPGHGVLLKGDPAQLKVARALYGAELVTALDLDLTGEPRP